MEDTILEVLESSEKELWLEYQKLREKGLRKDALKILEEFTNRLKLYSQEKLERWVYFFAKLYALMTLGGIMSREYLNLYLSK